MLRRLLREAAETFKSSSSKELTRRLQEALAHHQAGRLAEAKLGYEQILAIDERHAEALHFLGVLAYRQGEYERARTLIERSLSRKSSDPLARNNLGNALVALGRLDEALEQYAAAIALKPDSADPYVNRGRLLRGRGRLEEAVACYRQGISRMPEDAGLHTQLAEALLAQGKREEALESYRNALRLRPQAPELHSNLGNVLRDLGRFTESIASYRRAIELRADFGEAHYNLGNALRDVGRVEDSVRSYRQALAVMPRDAETHSSLLCALNYVPGLSPATIFKEHRDYAGRFSSAARGSHANTKEPGRKLRIGYVSSDFRMHPVARFVEPVILGHDRGAHAVYCYYNFPHSDPVTERLRASEVAWRDVYVLSDDKLAALVREDAIDILVDLNGHTGGNRLPVFARKPAPVQVTWLGYLNTTGLAAVDYRITDRHASPEGMFEAFHSERLWRLPDCQWCFRAPEGCPEVSPPPSRASGSVTYGAFANLAKIGAPVIETWSKLLGRAPGTRLLIVAPGLDSVRDEYAERFRHHGIDTSRIDLQERKPFSDYLAAHRAVDVILDTFPYPGGTTTCDGLWMGVPVVSLAGGTPASRTGAGLLRAAGLDELVAETEEQYIGIAAALGADVSRLAAMRSGMRARMAASSLMAAERFTRNLEQAYRTMWRTWCGK
jgi:predicted O-linked N-acetylglucosamine transferase (SPINDLY family)